MEIIFIIMKNNNFASSRISEFRSRIGICFQNEDYFGLAVIQLHYLLSLFHRHLTVCQSLLISQISQLIKVIK